MHWGTASQNIIALLAFVTVLALSLLADRRACYALVSQCLTDVTTGAVQTARHHLGSIMSDAGVTADTLSKEEKDALISDLFVLLWAFQRVYATDQALRSKFGAPYRGPYRLLQISLWGWVHYWNPDRLKNLAEKIGLLDEGAYKESAEGLRTLGSDWEQVISEHRTRATSLG